MINFKGEINVNLICEGLDLAEAVLTVSKAISAKTANPILEGIKLFAEDNVLTLSATDTDLAIEKKIKAEIKVEGETVVPGRFFCEFVKKLTNQQIELDLNEKNQLKIKYAESEGFISCFTTLEYPGFKKIDCNEYFAMTKKDLKSLITKSTFAVAIDESRPILKGVLLEVENNSIRAIALDGYRLALVNKPLAASNISVSVIVPARSLNEIAKLLDDSDEVVNVYIQKNNLMVDLDDTKIITKLLDGEFLNYKQIISSNYESVITINKAQFEDALERASLLSKVGQGNLVKFEIKEGNLCLSSNSELGNIKENVNIVLKGNDLNIAFNARYFMDALRMNSNEFVKINFNSSASPCTITPFEGDEFLYLILPVRILT